jgi:hypothetical protein
MNYPVGPAEADTISDMVLWCKGRLFPERILEIHMLSKIQLQVPISPIKHAVWLIFAICSLSLMNANAQARLKVGFGGSAGSECTSDEFLLAGSQYEIVISIVNRSDTTYRGLSLSPPEGLVLMAGLRTAEADTFIGSTEFLQNLHPKFFISRTQVRLDSNFRNGYRLDEWNRRPTYLFLIVIPEDLAGQTLCIHAAFDDSLYGHMEGSFCRSLVAPCSDGDRNKALGSYIIFAYESLNNTRAVELTDSLLQTGWRDWTALMFAPNAARELVRYDRALEYLDILYNTYGRVTPTGPRIPAREEETYQQMRTNLIELRDQQH